MIKALTFWFGVSIMLTACNQPLADPNPDPTPDDSSFTHTIRPAIAGVCWTAGDTLDASCLEGIQQNGVNYVSQTPFGYQTNYQQPEIQTFFDDHRMAWGESDAGLIHTAELAREKGISSMMKPHLWMRTQEGVWRSDIAMNSEEEWQQWFENYRHFILHYAEVAEAGRMESLCIGTELHQTVKQRPDDWRALIREIRKVYHGKLTYAANFNREYQDVTFWDELDYIGIQGYFPLTKSENPTVAELLEGWKDHAAEIEKVSKQYNKPVIFTEIGYKSTKDAAIRPWEWPDHRTASAEDTSYVTQARCYEAMFQTFAGKEWMHGYFIWKWHPGKFALSSEEEAERQARIAKWKAESPSIGFSPQGKPAEGVMVKWFKDRRE